MSLVAGQGTAAPVSPTQASWRSVVQVMGMPVSIVLRGRHAGDQAGQEAWRAVVAELREVDRVFSTYRPDSIVSRLDRGEIGLEDCPDEVLEVLALGERARVESDGAFDVHRTGPSGRRRLDPSGVVKGWAVQRASRHLAVLADTDHCLSAGGDMVCEVADPVRPAWRIGVEDPHQPHRLVAHVPVRHGAIATSSAAHRGEHITDARTGRPATGVASVTVLAADLTSADIDATAAFALGDRAISWLRTREARTAVVVLSDGSTVVC